MRAFICSMHSCDLLNTGIYVFPSSRNQSIDFFTNQLSGYFVMGIRLFPYSYRSRGCTVHIKSRILEWFTLCDFLFLFQHDYTLTQLYVLANLCDEGYSTERSVLFSLSVCFLLVTISLSFLYWIIARKLHYFSLESVNKFIFICSFVTIYYLPWIIHIFFGRI